MVATRAGAFTIRKPCRRALLTIARKGFFVRSANALASFTTSPPLTSFL